MITGAAAAAARHSHPQRRPATVRPSPKQANSVTQPKPRATARTTNSASPLRVRKSLVAIPCIRLRRLGAPEVPGGSAGSVAGSVRRSEAAVDSLTRRLYVRGVTGPNSRSGSDTRLAGPQRVADGQPPLGVQAVERLHHRSQVVGHPGRLSAKRVMTVRVGSQQVAQVPQQLADGLRRAIHRLDLVLDEAG